MYTYKVYIFVQRNPTVVAFETSEFLNQQKFAYTVYSIYMCRIHGLQRRKLSYTKSTQKTWHMQCARWISAGSRDGTRFVCNLCVNNHIFICTHTHFVRLRSVYNSYPGVQETEGKLARVRSLWRNSLFLLMYSVSGVCVHMHMYTYLSIYLSVYIYIYIYIHTLKCIYVYIYVYIYVKYPPKNWEIALWLPTNSSMCGKYVSQKWNELND